MKSGQNWKILIIVINMIYAFVCGAEILSIEKGTF